MELTAKQMEGLRIAVERYKTGLKYTVISGFAGAGKSTLIKFIIDALGVSSEHIAYAVPTGKAAEALRKRGTSNATTIHRLLYKYMPIGPGAYRRVPKNSLDDIKIVVVDEVSMVEQSMIDLLLSHDVYVLFCGDPGQIPPVNREQENHLLDAPHVFLDEIMRQAAESDIIKLSMEIRAHRSIIEYDGHDAKVYSKSKLNEGMLTWADQIIVATNDNRKFINQKVRDIIGKIGGVQEGDKVICGHNNWNILSDQGNPLINGTIGFLKNVRIKRVNIPSYMKWVPIRSFEVVIADVDTGEEVYKDLCMDKKLIETGTPGCDSKTAWALKKNKKTADLVPLDFEYGYAITGHKSQGSSWSKVLVIEERFPFEQDEHTRWLYTAVTRSEDRLVLLKK